MRGFLGMKWFLAPFLVLLAAVPAAGGAKRYPTPFITVSDTVLGLGETINRQSLKEMWVWEGQPLLDGRWAVVLLLAAFLTALVIRWAGERGEKVVLPRPGWTFLRVAMRLRLGPWDQWLLSRIAQAERLPTPLTLLVSAETLRHHGRRYLKKLTATQRAAAAQRIVRMERKIFGVRRYRAVDGGAVKKMASG